MAETVEIRSLLLMDDRSSAVVSKVAGGFDGLLKRVNSAQSEMGSLVRTSLAMAAGFQLDNGIQSMKEFGHEVLNAALGAAEEQKALAGAIAVGDRSGRTYEEIKNQAEGLYEELENLGVAAGASTASIMEAFGTIQARTTKSVEETKALTEEMVYAARAVPGGMEGLATAFRDLESGIFRPKNALVQLMIMTGTVEGSSKKVAKGLQDMIAAGKQDKVMELAESAISRMSEKMKNAPMSFKQVVESLKTIRENVFESIGVPILKALTGPLLKIKEYFVQNREVVEQWAKSVGEKVGGWIKKAAEKIQEGFQYLQTHADEIKAAIESGFNTARSVVEWIIAHKEEIAIAFGAKMVLPGAIGVAKGAAGIAGELAGMGGLGIKGGSLASGAGLASFGIAVAAFAAAVGAWKLATDQWAELNKLTHGKSDAQQNQDARKERLEQLGMTPEAVDTKEFDRLRSAYVAQADAMGMSQRAAGEYVDAVWEHHQILRRSAMEVDELAQRADQGDEGEAVKRWIDIFNGAVLQQNQAIQRYAANVIAGSEILQNAFLASGSNVEGGFDHLAELVSGRSEEFAKILKGMTGDSTKAKMPEKMSVNFNGNTFQIKQDFKDSDPDRVLLSFKRDIARQAVARSASRFGTPFGL